MVISAVYFGGAPLRILKAWRDGQLELVVTDDILNEYDEIAIVPWGQSRPKFKLERLGSHSELGL